MLQMLPISWQSYWCSHQFRCISTECLMRKLSFNAWLWWPSTEAIASWSIPLHQTQPRSGLHNFRWWKSSSSDAATCKTAVIVTVSASHERRLNQSVYVITIESLVLLLATDLFKWLLEYHRGCAARSTTNHPWITSCTQPWEQTQGAQVTFGTSLVHQGRWRGPMQWWNSIAMVAKALRLSVFDACDILWCL